jgi:hypothetical protein
VRPGYLRAGSCVALHHLSADRQRGAAPGKLPAWPSLSWRCNVGENLEQHIAESARPAVSPGRTRITLVLSLGPDSSSLDQFKGATSDRI